MQCMTVIESVNLQININQPFLGAFAKLRKAAISFVMSVFPSACLSVCKEELGSHWTDFYEMFYLSFSRKSVEKIQLRLKFDVNNGYFP